jgi:hypothetical protein
MLSEAYGGAVIKMRSVFMWHKRFKKGCMKTKFMTFFDNSGIVHFGFIAKGQTVNQAYYVEILNWLHEAAC